MIIPIRNLYFKIIYLTKPSVSFPMPAQKKINSLFNQTFKSFTQLFSFSVEKKYLISTNHVVAEKTTILFFCRPVQEKNMAVCFTREHFKSSPNPSVTTAHNQQTCFVQTLNWRRGRFRILLYGCTTVFFIFRLSIKN